MRDNEILPLQYIHVVAVGRPRECEMADMRRAADLRRAVEVGYEYVAGLYWNCSSFVRAPHNDKHANATHISESYMCVYIVQAVSGFLSAPAMAMVGRRP